MHTNTSLVVVGSGIKFLSHLTVEAKCHITQADIVLYLVNDPAMKNWITENNPRSESLDFLYTKYPLRVDCYRAISDYIMSVVDNHQHVCVVLYGHPSHFSQPGLNAVKRAQKQGIYAKILPGISAEDCLLADLCIDTGMFGCQSFETTDFLVNKRLFDPASHLILWQIDVIGALNHALLHDNKKGLQVLAKKLIPHYDNEHEFIMYEAAQYPSFDPLILKFKLIDLEHQFFSPISTLYVPPIKQGEYDMALAKELGMNTQELEKNNTNDEATT